MASAALPPGFPPIEIDGEHYWDGGVLSNTPLSTCSTCTRDDSMLVFQVDLFSAQGDMPRNLLDVYERHKDILYSSRTARTPTPPAMPRSCARRVERLHRETADQTPGRPRRALHPGRAAQHGLSASCT